MNDGFYADEPRPLPPFIQPSTSEMMAAEQIVDSRPVISAFAASEWDELNSDGQVWIAAIVREARAGAAKPSPIPGDLIVEINAFLTHMAERFRERTSRKVLGFRVHALTRMQAMQHALATYDATLDIIGIAFGDPSYRWDRGMAREFVDDELQHWEG